jgi:hypothetical protein
MLMVALAVPLAFAATAQAVEPTGTFSVFKQCPRFTKGVNFCLYAHIEGGEVTIGKSTVPLNADGKHAITLQGGYERNEEGEVPVEHFFGAINGETLSKTPQNVPGGLAGLINCTEIKGLGLLEILARTTCKTVFENGATGVNAITELAKPASEIGINSDNLTNEEGIALSLPAKVRLENPLLGSECYIGSSSEPVTFNLTDGTTSPPEPNKPISGKLGKLDRKLFEGFPYIEITENTLVDNAFSAPAATGCGGILAIILDPIINAKLGLPSTAGHNTAIQNGSQRLATAEDVIKEEK